MNKTETCGLCKRKINTKKDNFCHLEDYKNGKFWVEGYYHTICWNANLKRDKVIKEKLLRLLGNTEILMKRAGIEGGEMYEVR